MPVNNFKASDFIIDFIANQEGYSEFPYPDDDRNTIAKEDSVGYGHQIKPGEEYLRQGVSRQQAKELLKKDVVPYGNAVNQYVLVPLNQNKFDALLDFTYQFGIGAFRDSTLLKKINASASDEEIKFQFRRWVYDDGVKKSHIVNRREENIKIYFSPIPQDTKKKFNRDSYTSD